MTLCKDCLFRAQDGKLCYNKQKAIAEGIYTKVGDLFKIPDPNYGCEYGITEWPEHLKDY